ncbi:MAG: hypothetical protein U0575_16610 [Phycisphaerales bacterium]
MNQRRSFEWWWIAIGIAAGAGGGIPFGSIPGGIVVGAIVGLTIALVRASRSWRSAAEVDEQHLRSEHKKPHKHHKPPTH